MVARPFRMACAAVLGAALAAVPLRAGWTSDAQAKVGRGGYLVNTILACGNCHTPKGPDGRPLAGRELAGGGLSFEFPFYFGTASNITPDRETGIGNWSDAELKRAITEGVRPNHGRLAGVALAPMMWVNFYKALTPSDLDAVVAYLRSRPPVRSEIPLPIYRREMPRERYPDAEKGFTEADMTNPVTRGAYLATIGHCMECHTPAADGRTLYERALGQGGKQYSPKSVKGYPPDWPGSVARNIGSDAGAGIGGWTDLEIKRAITKGISRDGRALSPPMAFYWYAGLSSEDLDALVAWLRTVAPKE
jgi:mono/diheme cytochrome c family protein